MKKNVIESIERIVSAKLYPKEDPNKIKICFTDFIPKY